MWVLLCTLIFLAWAATVHAGTSIVLVGDSPAGATNFLMDAINSCSTLGQQYPGTTCAYQQISATALSDAAIAANWDSVIQSTNGDIFFGLSFMYGGALATVGPKYPSKSFVLYDSPVNPPVANVIGLTFAEDQSGFLAGAAAGVFTTSKKVGVIGGLAIPPVKRFVNGYLNGILSVCSTCEVYRIYQPSFADAALGQAAAQYLISKGADVIFGAGGSMGSAGILYAAQQNTFVIGVDTDESLSTFAGQTSGQYLLASAMKYVGVAVKSAFTAIQAGNRGNYNMLLDASLNGVGLNSPLVSNAVKNFTSSVQVSIKTSGSSCATSSFASRSDILSLMSSSLQRKQTVTQVTADTGDLTQLTRPANKTWYDMSPWGARSQVLPNMQGHGAVHVGNSQVLVYGGQSPFGAFPSTVMMLDYDPFEWKPVVDGGSGTLPAGRMFHAMGYDGTGNVVYVFGGQGAAGGAAGPSGILGDTWKYNVATAKWTAVTPGTSVPSGRTNMAHATVGRSMYVYGGVSSSGAVLDDLWAFDMAAGSWSAVTPVVSSSSSSGSAATVRPPGLQHATLVAVNGTNLVLYGGTDGSGVSRSDLYVFSPADRTWMLQAPSTLGSGPPPPVERMRGISVDSRRVIFTGGLGTNGALNSTWVWKMDENAWSANAYGSLPGTLHSHALVAFNQSANANACAWTIPGMPICSPASNFTLLAISGVTNNPGGGVVVSFANQDPLPPPVGSIADGIKWVVTVLNAAGLIGTFLLMAFVFVKREQKVVKATNPRFAVLILFGAALAHIGLIASTWQNDGRNSYMLTAFLVGTGYSLMFSALVVKTYMIYSIFTAKRVGAVKAKMVKYSGFIVFTTCLQCLLSALWFVTDKSPITSFTVGGTVWTVRSFDGNWVVLCSLPVVFLTLAGVFLSVKTRHVQSAFNESHYIGIATYAIALALLVVAPVILLLQMPLVQYIITALLTSLTTIGVVAIFFGHKVMAVFSPGQSTTEIVSESGTKSANSTEGGQASTTVRCKYCKQAIQQMSTVGSSSMANSQSAGTALRGNASPLKGTAPSSATPLASAVMKSGKQ